MIEELFFIKVLAVAVYILVGVLFTFAFIMMWHVKRDIEEWKKMYFWKDSDPEWEQMYFWKGGEQDAKN